MHNGPFPGNGYTTPEATIHPFRKLFPGLSFYWYMCGILKKAADYSKSGVYTDEKWFQSSLDILTALEGSGVRATFEGLDHYKNLEGPCVFVGNHMSTLETFVLPSLLQPYRPISFVVKESLLNYPIFKHVMRARNPIVVSRSNPKADFAAVMEGGCERLARGVSVVVFPQSTRSVELDPQHFNSMGAKLARKAGVPLIPLALRTDAWGMNGLFGLLKDHGPIRPELPVHISFGAPMTISGNGKEEHAATLDFIEKHLLAWGGTVAALPPAETA